MEATKEKTARTIGTVYIYIYIYQYFYKRIAGQSGERELHFSKIECGFVQQSSTRTSNVIENRRGCKVFGLNMKNNKLLAMCNVNMAD